MTWVPPPPPPPPATYPAPPVVAPTVSELDRILALPQREPLDCERERGTRRWSPQAQALVEHMTAMYARRRISCGCRDRHVQVLGGGRVIVFHQPPPGAPPGPPLETTVEALYYDSAHDPNTAKIIGDLRVGETVRLKGLAPSERPFACFNQLNPVQAWVLYELPQVGGILGFISAGGGKTAAGILAPLAVANRVRTVALLAKPRQRLHYRNNYLRVREHFQVPSIVFDKSGVEGSFIVPGTPVVYFIPYSLLSQKKSTTLLEQLDPDMFVGDEIHLFANPTATRTIRFLRVMGSRNGRILVGWSGSLINKSMKDVAHLSAHSLGLGSPYPIKNDDVEAMSAVIDPSYQPDRTSDFAKKVRMAFGAHNIARPLDLTEAMKLSDLMTDGGVREGHRDRVMRTPGVISTRSASVNCSINLHERRVVIPETVRNALAGVRQNAVRPDGEELVEALEIVTTAREVAAGYYDYWAFPNGEPHELIDAWFEARKAFFKAKRMKVRNAEPHLDSSKLCEEAAARAFQHPRYDGPLPVWPEPTWLPWIEIKDQVKPDPRTRWIDDYLARDAAQWAAENVGIVWVQSRAFGLRVAQLAGINYHAGGAKGEERLLAETGKQSIVCSLNAYGESTDGLQHLFHQQLVAELPASGKAWEQLLARLARDGQRADEVETYIYQHVEEYRDAFRQAYELALFDEAYTPNKQLLLTCEGLEEILN